MASSAETTLLLIITSRFTSVDKTKQSIRVSPVSLPARRRRLFLHHIIDNIVDEYLPVMDDFDERINALEDNIFSLATRKQRNP